MYKSLAGGLPEDYSLIERLSKENEVLANKVRELQVQLDNVPSTKEINFWWIGGIIILLLVVIWIFKKKRKEDYKNI